MMRFWFTPLLFSAILWITAGCTKERNDDCLAGLRLNFNFSLHKEGGNRFGSDVHAIRVFVFDEDGVLYHIQESAGVHLTNSYAMNIQVKPGKYSAIAWGSSDEDFKRSFHEGHMIGSQTTDYREGVVVGETTINDFRIFLDNQSVAGVPDQIAPIIAEFDDLYYGAVGSLHPQTSKYNMEAMELRAGTITEREIELIRNTNVIRVRITGIQNFKGSLMRSNPDVIFENKDYMEAFPRAWITIKNAEYMHDNAIGYLPQLIHYPAYFRDASDIETVLEFKVLRLDLQRHITDPAYLIIEGSTTGVLWPNLKLDLMNVLLQARESTTGNLIYRNQVDFDKIYMHPIDIVIGADFSVRIFIHGWEYVTVRPEL